MKKPKKKLKKFTVYVPCGYSEVYHVEAETKAEAFRAVRDGNAVCVGESITQFSPVGGSYGIEEGHQ